MSSRLGAQVLALKPIQGHSQKCVTDKQTDRQTDKQTHRQTDRQPDRGATSTNNIDR